MKYEVVKTKNSIMNRYSITDSWFWINASINPYRGCEHNCVYCDGKAEYYRIEYFGTHIRVKVNAPQLLTKELSKLGFSEIFRPGRTTLLDYIPVSIQEKKAGEIKHQSKPHKFTIAIGGGVCDVYQPAEEQYKVTRAILEVCRNFGFPISVLTKNALILRDLDILKEINDISYTNVSFSITLANERHRKIMEPGGSPTSVRFSALKKVRKAGLHGGVMFMPILPGIGDTEENMRAIISQAKEVGAEFVLPAGLTLKPGRNKTEFLQVITEHFPEHLAHYKEIYHHNNKYGIPDTSKARNVAKKGHSLCKEYGLPDRIPRYLGNTRINLGIRNNLRISELLYEIGYLSEFVYGYGWTHAQAYKNAAQAIENYPKDVNNLSINELQQIPNVGTSIVPLVREILETGTCKLREQLN